ncbi:HNH endonuclease [Jatrophihabitans cynanchi]|uniref:HNH endonuclease n=1 Tax=Jatrophihabitans cynanchi TaxID=2944128 RepID=A0ABY7K426_9ACTN|nr:HNH endonuclease signature motif containing protein [Jatrophihabitans sp. SB3-54]WAX58663.1 HNH endonuclease [Jatrophihabitans sp. SB3-54]
MGESDQIVVDRITVDLVDPALYTPLPTASDVLHRPDQVAEAATVLTPSGAVLTAMESLLPTRLSGTGLIDALAACDRLRALVDAKQVELLAELRDRDSDGTQFLQDEVGCALHLAPGTAHERLQSASELTGRLWDTFELMRGGYLSAVHARILAAACADLPDAIVAKVQAQVLKRAPGQTPGEFRASVRRAIAKHDAKSQAEKHRQAAEQRHVRKEHVDDGMGWLNLFAPTDGIETVWTAVNAWGQRTSRDDTRTADQRRADALVEICAAALAMPGVPVEHGLRPTVNVTLAASTLAGQDDQPGYVNGEPVPADVARRMANQPGARYHYWPVDQAGRLLDQTCPQTPNAAHAPSTSTGPVIDSSLITDRYQPTTAITRHVITRDQHCVMPGCRRRAHTCELDHRTPWPDGPTSVTNLEPLCTRHHDLKHHARWTLTRTPDGTYHWTSATRHHYHYRPPELPVPQPEPPKQTGPDPNDQPPPY